MTTPDYTLVIAVDDRHLRQLSWTWPTWRKHKPSLMKHPMLIIYDQAQVTPRRIKEVVDRDAMCCPWPPEGFEFAGGIDDKWNNPQRVKMLTSFVYMPSVLVRTPYWLKIDTDVVATGMDEWIDPGWFKGNPAIVAHPWTFTRPAGQMLDLDRWAEEYHLDFPAPPLNLVPNPGASRVGHKRITSWCSFFRTDFSGRCTSLACRTTREKLPVPSQDGYTFYVAKRMGEGIVRTSMKVRGWQQWSTDGNVEKYAKEALV